MNEEPASRARASRLAAFFQQSQLIATGAVGGLFFNFFNRESELVDHPIMSWVMSVPVSSVRGARSRILASGGRSKIPALLAACRLVRPTILVIDEATTDGLLAAARSVGEVGQTVELSG